MDEKQTSMHSIKGRNIPGRTRMTSTYLEVTQGTGRTERRDDTNVGADVLGATRPEEIADVESLGLQRATHASNIDNKCSTHTC